MIDKYKNQYRIQSSRLQGYDYSQNGLYFITICTKNKEHFFGEIENGKMILNDIGKIADQSWLEIPKYFPHANLDIYQVMPNHIHGIIEIINNNNIVETPNLGVSNLVVSKQAGVLEDRRITGSETPGSGVSTRGGENINWKSGCLGVIINQYKRICTLEIKKQLNPILVLVQVSDLNQIFLKSLENTHAIRQDIKSR